MTRPQFFRRTLFAVAAIGSMSACQGSDVAEPTRMAASAQATQVRVTGTAPNGIGFLGNAANDFHAARCTDRRSVASAGTFGPGGGTLTFGDSRLVIPAGALTDTVTISATVVDSATSRVEFRPHGLQFAKAAGLLLGTSGCVLSPDTAPTVVYLSESGEVLETIPAVYDPRWKTFAAPIVHFSGYAIAF